MPVDLKTQNINSGAVASEVKTPAKAQAQTVLKYEPDVVTISDKNQVKKENKSVLGMLLMGIGAAGMLTLLIVNRKSVGEFLGIAKKEGNKIASKANSNESIPSTSEIDEVITKVEKGENIIDDAPTAQTVKPAQTAPPASTLKENVLKTPEKATFTEIPNPNIPAEVPLPFPAIVEKAPTITPLAKAAETTAENVSSNLTALTNQKIASIEANSTNPYDVLYTYYKNAANTAKKDEKDVISLIAGQRLIDNYQAKLVDTGSFARVAENLANIHYKKGNFSDAEKLLNLVVKNSDDSVQNADVYEQLAVIAQKAGRHDDMKSNYLNSFKQRMKTVDGQYSKVIMATNNSERLLEQVDLTSLGTSLKSFYERVSSKGVDVPHLKEAITYIDAMDLRGAANFSNKWSAMTQKIN